MIHSTDVSVRALTTSEVFATTGGDTTALVTKLDNAHVRIAILEPVKIMNVRRHEELLEEVTQCQSDAIGVWKETSSQNADSPIDDVKVVKTDSVKMSVQEI